MPDFDPTLLGDLVVVDAETGCWLWQLSVDKDGYGKRGSEAFYSQYGHRYTYELYIGPVPAGLELDHLCRVRACVFPAHLEPVTHAENMRRSREARRTTHCAHGHKWTDETRRVEKKTGQWSCRICNVAAVQRYRARKKEQNA